MNLSKDGLVSVHTSWVCVSTAGLADILVTNGEEEEVSDHLKAADPLSSGECQAVRLEQGEEGSPCIITLLCTPQSGVAITSVLVVSQARTIEAYSLSGDYCGTGRGQEDPRWSTDGAEENSTFYRCHLELECPVASCEVKLLSLGGRVAVGIGLVVIGLQRLQATRCTGLGVDLQRVQTMMDEMGTTLSPGAQNLMEMVQFQQKNKADVLGGFLPLLMGGGALACLSKGSAPVGELGSEEAGPHTGPPPQSGTHPPPPPSVSGQGGILDCTSALLASPSGQQGPVSPDLLPVLQSVCGQVSQLRLHALTSAEKKKNGDREHRLCCGGVEEVLEKVVERRMQELERRLKEHVDLRLDALQQRLELALHQALAHAPHLQ
ncbi:ATPase PAAT isoform X2 [Brachyhypopomus gauderio]|uniref:ATPase PAAT isoform X2 n=1 Tax=Brachyhypopomus gauderio TaxID=698409 RepID=UPI0040424158